jgi:hypothetical protein
LQQTAFADITMHYVVAAERPCQCFPVRRHFKTSTINGIQRSGRALVRGVCGHGHIKHTSKVRWQVGGAAAVSMPACHVLLAVDYDQLLQSLPNKQNAQREG